MALAHTGGWRLHGLMRRWRSLSIITHSWMNPLIVVLAVVALYAIDPSDSNPAYSAIFLSYPLRPEDPLVPSWQRRARDAPVHYGKGRDDLKFIGFYAVLLTFIRQFLMEKALRPMAKWSGIYSRPKQNRFLEQVYTALYYSISVPLGVYVMRRTPVWYFNTHAMFEQYPHRSHEAAFKAYYLLQASFWAHQAIVILLRLEKPRNDFKVFAAHHVVTITLIGLSYRFHFTYMGLPIFITHDLSDFFFATSKTLSYMNSRLTQPYFLLFVFSWIYLRHYINLSILYSILTEFKTVGPFVLDWVSEQYKWWVSQWITFGLLASLQLMNLFWLALITRVGYNIVFYNEYKDVRSDDEGSMDGD